MQLTRTSLEFLNKERHRANEYQHMRIKYIDMLDECRAEGKKRQLYLFRDTHWNESGNELAAKIIFRHMPGYFEK